MGDGRWEITGAFGVVSEIGQPVLGRRSFVAVDVKDPQRQSRK
jgi:hypothetical protein